MNGVLVKLQILHLLKVLDGLSVGWMVCRLDCHNFLKGRKVTLPCSYRNLMFGVDERVDLEIHVNIRQSLVSFN